MIYRCADCDRVFSLISIEQATGCTLGPDFYPRDIVAGLCPQCTLKAVYPIHPLADQEIDDIESPQGGGG